MCSRAGRTAMLLLVWPRLSSTVRQSAASAMRLVCASLTAACAEPAQARRTTPYQTHLSRHAGAILAVATAIAAMFVGQRCSEGRQQAAVATTERKTHSHSSQGTIELRVSPRGHPTHLSLSKSDDSLAVPGYAPWLCTLLNRQLARRLSPTGHWQLSATLSALSSTLACT